MTQASKAAEARSVSPDYVHADKFVVPGNSIKLVKSTLKWYNLARADEPVMAGTDTLARAFLERESSEGKLNELGDLGFVILHRCGAEFYFLLVNSWRNENEVWETVYAKVDDSRPDFEPFTSAGTHRATFCVWELAAVWHEQQAWRRYLLSERNYAAVRDYLRDHYDGRA